jgi:ArsR family transcriptional regulator, virulence genes transcriptional regulator
MSRRGTSTSEPECAAARLSFDPEEMRVHADDAARLLKALSNSARLMVLCSLAQGELTVGQINERVPLSQSALSQHLAVLRRDGLVQTRRSAQTIYYRLAEGPAGRIIETLHGIYCGTSEP